MLNRIACLALTAAMLAACGSEESQTVSATPTEAVTDNTAAANSSSAAPQAMPATDIPNAATASRGFGPGVPAVVLVEECDQFIEKYQACMREKAPAESRDAMWTVLKTWRNTWRELAASPTTRSTLAESCKMAQESVRSQMTSFGCEL